VTENLNKERVVVEVIEETKSLIKSIKRQPFIKAKVISVGSGIRYLRRDDVVTLYNEGVQFSSALAQKTRVVNAESIVLKES
jgi:hypothetical protein